MKIGYFVSEYPRHPHNLPYFWGGVGEAAAALAEEMVKLGHEVVVVTSSPSREAHTRNQNGVRVEERPTWFTLSQASIAPSLMWSALDFDFDIVHAHAGNPPAPLGALLYQRIRHVPLVVTYHGDPQPTYGAPLRKVALRFYIRLLLKRLLESANMVCIPSAAFRAESHVLQLLDVHTTELPNGVPSWVRAADPGMKREARGRLSIPGNARVALFLGSLNPYKDPETLVRACAIVKAEEPAFRCVIAGTGLLRENLEHLSRDLGLSDTVRFDGYVPEERKRYYFDAADVFALPSSMTTEVFPVALLEALGTGVPVIVSDLCTFRRFVVPGRNGLVVRRGDVSALAEAILRIVNHEDERAAMSSAARESVREFNWPAIAAQAGEIYERLVTTRN